MAQILQCLGVNSHCFFFLVLVDVLSVVHYLRDRFALWLIIFCALALFDCACDMDHESVINELLLL